METSPFSPKPSTRVGVRLVTAIAIVALASLTGCSSGAPPVPKVTVTITPSPTPTPTETGPYPIYTPEPVVTPEPVYTPDPVVTPEPDPDPDPEPQPEPNVSPSTSGGVTLGVSRGGVSPACTNSTCWYVHLEWEGLTKASHRVQCVTDAAGLNVWSDNSYYFSSTSGDRELQCFLGYPGSHVWVVIDQLYESNHVTWG